MVIVSKRWIRVVLFLQFLLCNAESTFEETAPESIVKSIKVGCFSYLLHLIPIHFFPCDRIRNVYLCATNDARLHFFNQIGYGKSVDCVDLYSQPSLKHPLLMNHTIQVSVKFDLFVALLCEIQMSSFLSRVLPLERRCNQALFQMMCLVMSGQNLHIQEK